MPIKPPAQSASLAVTLSLNSLKHVGNPQIERVHCVKRRALQTRRTGLHHVNSTGCDSRWCWWPVLNVGLLASYWALTNSPPSAEEEGAYRPHSPLTAKWIRIGGYAVARISGIRRLFGLDAADGYVFAVRLILDIRTCKQAKNWRILQEWTVFL